MKVWSEDDYHLTKVTLVPLNLKNSFNEFVECDLIKYNNEVVFYVSYNCLSNDDLFFIKNIIDWKFFGLYNNEIVSFLNFESSRYNFGSCHLAVKSKKATSMLQAKYYNSLKEIFFLMDDLLNRTIVESPFSFEDADISWLDNQLSVSKFLENEAKFNYLDSCLITGSIKDNIKKLREFTNLYSHASPIRKLAYLSSWYLFNSVVSSYKGDYTKAILLLHRATETCFISWLLAERLITIDRNGDVIRDSYTYLLGYMELLKPERSFSDDQTEMIRRLNELRNKSKYAHGYMSATRSCFDSLFHEVSKLICEDLDLCEGFKILEHAFKIRNCINDLSYNFLIKDNYLERAY